MKYRVVLSTAPSLVVARRLSSLLLRKKLAGCINILPKLESHYLWKGKKQKTSETLLIIKTTAKRMPELKKQLIAAHPYDVPEIIALPVHDGFKPYLNWLEEMCR